MPFKSLKQKQYMFANHTEIAKKWEHEEDALSRPAKKIKKKK